MSDPPHPESSLTASVRVVVHIVIVMTPADFCFEQSRLESAVLAWPLYVAVYDLAGLSGASSHPRSAARWRRELYSAGTRAVASSRGADRKGQSGGTGKGLRGGRPARQASTVSCSKRCSSRIAKAVSATDRPPRRRPAAACAAPAARLRTSVAFTSGSACAVEDVTSSRLSLASPPPQRRPAARIRARCRGERGPPLVIHAGSTRTPLPSSGADSPCPVHVSAESGGWA